MQMFAFFLAMFTSTSWLIYAIMFVRSKLEAEGLWEQSPEMMMLLLAVIVLPILTIWMIFGYVNQYINNKQINRKQSEILMQLQKNQDYTDLVVRVMLDAEHEIKDGFVINKFEVLINDMNEALSEIIQRCNIASSTQLEQLWQRVGRGERWMLGKAILEASKSRSTFDAWAREKAGRDKVFRGSLLEFCSRYQNLLQLLEKHDRDRVFLRMIEMGVLGKVYSIIAPLSSGIDTLSADRNDHYTSTNNESVNDYASVLKLATMAEPTAQDTIVNVDKDDTETQEEDSEYEKKPSILSRFKLFGRKDDEEQTPSMADQDPFFRALHNSFKSETGLNEPTFGSESIPNEPSLSSESSLSIGEESKLSANISSFDGGISISDQKIEESKETKPLTGLSDFAARLAAVRGEAVHQANSDQPIKSAVEKQITSATSEKEDNEDLVYPFGGWTNEAGNQ